MMKNEKTDSKVKSYAVSKMLAVDILDGRWKIGDRLTLDDIQTLFAVSRTVAREASKTLEDARAVTLRRRVGLVARPVEEWAGLDSQVVEWKLASVRRKEQLFALEQLRTAIEPLAAALCAAHAPLEVRAKLPLLAEQMRLAVEKNDLESFHQLDNEFHSVILMNTGNSFLTAFDPITAAVLRGRVELDLYSDKPAPGTVKGHIAVAQAIWEGNDRAARKYEQDIVNEVSEALVNTVVDVVQA